MWYYCFRLHFCKNYFLKNSNKFLFTLLIVMLIYRNIDSEIVFMEVISSIIFCALSSLACTNFLTSKLKIKWVDMPDGFLAFYRIKILLQQFLLYLQIPCRDVIGGEKRSSFVTPFWLNDIRVPKEECHFNL